MKQIKACTLLIVLCLGMVLADQANLVRTTSYVAADKPPIITTTYLNGFNREIENQIKLNSVANNAIVGGTYYDALGRDSLVIKDYVTATNDNFVLTKDFALVTQANGYWGVDDYAYAETRYYPDVLDRVKEQGIPGEPYSLHPDEGHHSKYWYFGVCPSMNENFDTHGFIKPEKLSESILDDINTLLKIIPAVDSIIEYDTQKPSDPIPGLRVIVENTGQVFEYGETDWNPPITPPAYSQCYVKSSELTYYLEGNTWTKLYFYFHLEVVKNANDQYTQTLKDALGRMISTWTTSNTSPPVNKLISTYDYNILGEVLKELPPDLNDANTAPTPEDFARTYKYDTRGDKYQAAAPDDGTTLVSYDRVGRPRFTKTALHAAKEEGNTFYYLVNDYDAFSRVTLVWEYIGDHSFDEPDFDFSDDVKDVKVISIYDDITSDRLDNIITSAHALVFKNVILPELQNLKNNLVCQIAINPKQRNIVEIFSYDKENRIQAKYILIPEIGTQKIAYEYNLAGIAIKQTYYNGYDDNSWQLSSEKMYEYNTEGRLEYLVNGNGTPAQDDKLINYSYDNLGNLKEKSFLKKGSNTEVLEAIKYDYTLQQFPEAIYTKINTGIFREDLYYEKVPASGFVPTADYQPQYNGMVSGIAYQGSFASSGGNYNYNLSYFYDGLNRLTGVAQDVPVSGVTKDFDETIAYDNMGRITSKSEGSFHLLNYTYPTGTVNNNRLKYIAGTTGDPSTKPQVGGQDNYLYDPNGNMVLDRSKKMVVEYNWADMPVSFTFYNAIPLLDEDSNPLSWEDLAAINGRIIEVNSVNVTVTMVTRVDMVYNAEGQRVQKLSYESGN